MQNCYNQQVLLLAQKIHRKLFGSHGPPRPTGELTHSVTAGWTKGV